MRNRCRHGFTLMEMLIVIAIIALLASMLFAGIQIAKSQARKAKTRALIANVSSALGVYHSNNGVYPEHEAQDLMSGTTHDASGQVSGTASDTFDRGEIRRNGRLLLAAIAGVDRDSFGSGSNAQVEDGALVDVWGQDVRYRPFALYPYLLEHPPNPDTFQVWSAGPDVVDGYLEPDGGDDIANW